jgi:hypothetical protein
MKEKLTLGLVVVVLHSEQRGGVGWLLMARCLPSNI